MTGPLSFPPESEPLEPLARSADVEDEACRGSSSGYGTAPENGHGMICVDEPDAIVQPTTE